MRWYNRVINAPEGDYNELANALAWYDAEYEEAIKVLNLEGKRIDKVAAMLGGLMSYYFGIQQEIDGIHQWLEVNYTKTFHKARKGYLENYPRQLSERAAGQYAEADATVLAVRSLINEVALRNNLFQGITKGLEVINFRVGDVTRLRTAGLDDAVF
jgi:hypothetical protein